MPFLHPQAVRLGRVNLTIPGPGAQAVFTTTEVSGVALAWIALKPSQTFEGAWKQERASIEAHDNIISDLPSTSDRVGVVSFVRTDIKAFIKDRTNSIEVWKRYGEHVLQAVSDNNDPKKMQSAMADLESVLAHFKEGAPAVIGTGFGIEGGTITADSENVEKVRGAVLIPLDSKTHVVLDVFTEVMDGTQEDSLLPRIDKAMQGEPLPRSLKRGARTVSGLHGHEYVDVSPDPRSTDHFVFSAYFEFGGVADQALQPAFHLGIDPMLVPKTINPQDLLALWEAILDSAKLTY